MKNSPLFNRLNELMEKTDIYMSKAPWENKEFYANWLAQTNHYTNHTTRLLALAGALLPLQQQPLHNRFLKHAAEEKGHENLSLLDLKHLGRPLQDYPESAATQAFYQVQYYWIEHCEPSAFFGFILYLEQLAAQFGKKLGKRVEDAHGPKCSHFLKVHADEDVEHVAEAIANVEKMSPETQASIMKNLDQCAALYQAIVEQCAAEAYANKAAA